MKKKENNSNNEMNIENMSGETEEKTSYDMENLEAICEGALYQEVRKLKDGKSIVMDAGTEKLYYRKELEVYSIPVFEYIKNNKSTRIPELKVYWEEQGKLICIEEFIQGKTLEEFLEGRPSFEERKRILLEVCDGIIFLHSANPPIIHRDIKASNIMITDDGLVKIIDYDAAKQFLANKGKDTVLMGTQGIAAPEQYGFGQSDERTDIYAMGKLLERVMPDVRDANKIITKATRIEPDLRYRSMSELKNHIANLWDPAISKSLRKKIIIKKTVKSKIFKRSIAALIILICLGFGAKWFKDTWYPTLFLYRPAYNRGVEAMENEEYDAAIREFKNSNGYKDSEELISECNDAISYNDYKEKALDMIDAYRADKNVSNAETAVDACSAFAGYGEEGEKLYESFYDELEEYIEELLGKHDWVAAQKMYDMMYRCGYEQAKDKSKDVTYKQAEYNIEMGHYMYAYDIFLTISGYRDADERALECEYKYGLSCIDEEKYTDAVDAFENVEGYKDADEKRLLAMYKHCDKYKEKRDIKAHNYIQELLDINYPGAEALSEIIYTWHADILFTGASGESISYSVAFYGGPYGEYDSFTLKLADADGNVYDERTIEAMGNGHRWSGNFTCKHGNRDIKDLHLCIYAYDSQGNEIGRKEK